MLVMCRTKQIRQQQRIAVPAMESFRTSTCADAAISDVSRGNHSTGISRANNAVDITNEIVDRLFLYVIAGNTTTSCELTPNFDKEFLERVCSCLLRL